MDFLDPKKRRAHQIKLWISYAVIGVVIGIGTLILLYSSYGYGVNRKTGEIIQNGMVFVNAQPERAQIYINDEKHRDDTDARLVLAAGDYTIELRRDGYRSWRRSFSLAGGSIERFLYPFLFPESLNTEDVLLYADTPPLATASPSREWLLVQTPGGYLNFSLFDMRKVPATERPLTLPEGLLTAAGDTHALSVVEWADDNRRVLLKHSHAGGHEFIVFDRENPTESININQTFALNPAQVQLRDKKWDLYYFYAADTQTLQVADLKTRKAESYANQVLAFTSHGSDRMLLATSQGAPEGKVRVILREDDEEFVLPHLAQGSRYLLDLTQFNGQWYVVTGVNTEPKVAVYKNPADALRHSKDTALRPIAELTIDNPEKTSFSPNARFVAVQGGNRFAVYDAEMERLHTYTVAQPLEKDVPATWMDGHRLLTNTKGQVLVFDYDGTNDQMLSRVSSPTGTFFDRDYRSMYNLAPSVSVPNRSALTWTELRATLSR